ncbi:MAG: ATP-binding protein [Azonexus sp.]
MLWISTILINLFVISVVALLIEQQREQEELQANTLTENYSKILEEALTGFIGKIDITLLSVRDEVSRQMAHGGIDEKALETFIAAQDSHIPQALGLRVVDADGIIRYAINDIKVRNVSIADRPQFIRLRDEPEAGLVFSKPVLGRAAQKWMITLGRRINHPDGSFAGDVHVAVAVDQFIEMFSRINLGARGNIGLWDSNSLIARYTRMDTHGATVGSTSPSPELHALLNSGQQTANYSTRSGVDGIFRTFFFRKLNAYPLYLVVGLAKDDYMAEWQRDSLQMAGLAALFVLTSVFSSLLIYRAWKRREADHASSLRLEAEYTAKLEASNRATVAARQHSEVILESAGEGICGVDNAGRIIFINPAAREMFGWDADEGLGLDLHATTHHHTADGCSYLRNDCEIAKTLADGRRRQVYDDLYWRKDGSSFPVEFTVSVIEAEGKISGAVNVFRDISEQKKNDAELELHRDHLEKLVQQRTAELLETETRASHILDSSADGLYGTDTRGVVSFINPAACSILGYSSSEQVVGQPAHRLFHHSKPDGTPYPAGECPSLNALTQGGNVRITDEVYWRADGQPVPVMYATHPMIQDGRIVGAVTSFIDVTEQRATAMAREQALLAAENLATIRREFLANMSHEIRTPLNGVLGFAEIGCRNYQNSEKAHTAFTKIQASGQRLLGVINDILDFSKIEAGKLQIEQSEISLGKVIDNAADLVRDRAHARHIELRIALAPNLPQTCTSDALRLGQVLLNILSNAIKFTEAGSVTLSAFREGEMLVFRITDSGIGMSREQLGELFNPFHQADTSATRKFGGTGLGLAISKRILELMGGEIQIDSQPGLGTTVEFRLPYVPTRQPGKTPVLADDSQPKLMAGALNGISILVVEDEIINQTVLEENLAESGARVTLANNGKEAVERVLAAGPDAFDIVLMDIQMPEMDGYQATLKIHEIAPDLPIIAQTAHAFSEERERCLQAGMIGHIAKPIDMALLVDLVKQHALVAPDR